MRYRRLDENGDYVLGRNVSGFVFDSDAVAQAIGTRLRLYLGTFWRDLSDGFPLFQNILGTSGDASNLGAVDSIIRQRILGTPNAQALTFFNSAFNPDTRQYSYVANVQTAFSLVTVQGNI